MSTATLLGGLIFGSIGTAAFIYGKKQASGKAMVVGILLVAFPYFVPNPIALFAVGVLLTAALFINV